MPRGIKNLTIYVKLNNYTDDFLAKFTFIAFVFQDSSLKYFSAMINSSLNFNSLYFIQKLFYNSKQLINIY